MNFLCRIALLPNLCEYFCHAAAPQSDAVAKHCEHFYDTVCLFIDGTLQQITHPQPRALAAQGLLSNLTLNLLQEAMFCYKKYHALKFQAIIAPCGIAVSAFGPVDGRRHDTTLLALSGVMEKLDGLVYNGIDYNIYGDKAYGMGPHFLIEYENAAPLSAEVCLNKSMATVRTCTSEWYYQCMKNTCQNLHHSEYQMAFKMHPANQYLCGILIMNILTYLNGNIISAFFNSGPPELDDYLHSAQWLK